MTQGARVGKIGETILTSIYVRKIFLFLNTRAEKKIQICMAAFLHSAKPSF
jgi:hypothetical protein